MRYEKPTSDDTTGTRLTPASRLGTVLMLWLIVGSGWLGDGHGNATTSHRFSRPGNANLPIGVEKGYRLDLVPNDPFYADRSNVPGDFQRWMFNGIGDDRNLDTESAWGVTTGRPDVVVAVVDSGVLTTHPDLRDNLWTNPREIPGNRIDDDGNGFVDDANGWDFVNQSPSPVPDLGNGRDDDGDGAADENVFHGTFVAGLVAARGNNRLGIAGTTWNCRIMALKVFPADGPARPADIAAAIRYAAANGARIVTLSFSAPTVDSEVRDAVAFARSRNVLVVASAGDANTDGPRFPARLPGVLSVGASASGLRSSPLPFRGENIAGRAPFTTFGPAAVDVVAPGHALSTSVLSLFDERSGEGRAGTPVYAFAAGSSVSTALVSGIAALVFSRAADLGQPATAERVRRILLETARDLPDDPNDRPDAGRNWAGRGRVEAITAIEAVTQPAATPDVAAVRFDTVRDRLVVMGNNFTPGAAVVALDGQPLPPANHRYGRITSGIARKITVGSPAVTLSSRRIQVTVTNTDTGRTSLPILITLQPSGLSP